MCFLFLQLVVCHRHDCLLFDPLLGDLLHHDVVCSECDRFLSDLLGYFFVLLPYEGSVQWHLNTVMYFVLLPPEASV